MPTVLTLFFTWSGTNKEILANITKEGKKLMATAGSVFTEVTNDLINGTILVGHLELILLTLTVWIRISPSPHLPSGFLRQGLIQLVLVGPGIFTCTHTFTHTPCLVAGSPQAILEQFCSFREERGGGILRLSGGQHSCPDPSHADQGCG